MPMHVAGGQYNQFKSQLTPRLYQVIRRIQKTQSVTKPPRTRQPITVKIMEGIQYVSAAKAS